jgi:hypothetical protein
VGQLLVWTQYNLSRVAQNDTLVSNFLDLRHCPRYLLPICASTKVIIDCPTEELVQNKVSIRVQKGGLGIGDGVQNSQGGLEKQLGGHERCQD